MSPATPHTRELAERESDGIYVLLLWHPREERAHGLRRGRPLAETASNSRLLLTEPSTPSTTHSRTPPSG